MRKASAVLAFLVFSIPLFASDLASINTVALPQEPAILTALRDAQQMEPYSQAFAGEWSFPTPKKDVAQHLGEDLAALRTTAQAHPENAELQLLTGLVARYAYNVDVEGSHDAAMEALGAAQRIVPGDVRSSWFRATLECQTSEVVKGARDFLAIEADNPASKLPADFWNDYMACAWITGMPAHVLRAADHLKQMHAEDSESNYFLADPAQKRFDAFDPTAKYAAHDAWSAEAENNDVQFTSTMCGVRFSAHRDWRANRIDFQNGSCIAYFSTGPYQAVTEQLHPSVLLLVQRPKESEALEQYARRFMKDGPLQPYTPSHCPAEKCLAYTQDAPGMYGANGNGHGRLVVFERDEPAYPGLALESPGGFPKTDSKDPVVFHPEQVRKRIPGKLYYVVLLDAAASIEAPAMKDFDFFLTHLVVE